MSEHEPFKPEDDVVERAAAALRDVETPGGPSAELLADVLSAIRAKDSSKRRFWTMKTIAKMAAAAVLAIAIGGVVWTGGPWGGQAAFADVLEKVQRVRSVRFKAEVVMAVPSGAPNPTKGTVTMLIVGDRMRVGDPGGGMVNVMDFKAGEMLMLMPKSKQAMRMHVQNAPKQMRNQNVLEHFRNMSANAGKPIGRKEIDGRVLDAYAVKEPGQETTVWTDPTTRLPVRMESSLDMGPMTGGLVPTKSDVVMKDFEWDVAADESEISLDIPAGYKVADMPVDMTKPSEGDIVTGLRTLAAWNGGRFPETLDMAGVVGAMKGLKAAAAKADEAQGAEMMKSITPMMRGLIFVQKANGEDFHYAGRGVMQGEKGRGVFWYRPAGSQTYHVIDADLTVREGVDAAGLPKGESQVLKAGAMLQGLGAPATKEVK